MRKDSNPETVSFTLSKRVNHSTPHQKDDKSKNTYLYFCFKQKFKFIVEKDFCVLCCNFSYFFNTFSLFRPIFLQYLKYIYFHFFFLCMGLEINKESQFQELNALKVNFVLWLLVPNF